MSSNRSRRAFTLTEVLVASALTLITCGSVLALITMTADAFGREDRRAPVFRAGVEALEVMTRDLQACRRIYAPDPSALESGFSLDGRYPLVITVAGSTGDPVARGYRLGADGSLERATGEATSLDVEATRWPAESVRRVARGVRSVKIRSLAGPGDRCRLQVDIVAGDGSPLETQVVLPLGAVR